MKTIKIFEVSRYCGGSYSAWLENYKAVDSIEHADLVLFKGGHDVNPKLYNQLPHQTTHFHEERDAYEKQIYDYAVTMDKKILGVCRGSQFLSVMQKASLWQDIEGHGRSHFCDIDQNLHPEFPEKILITSSHHQCLNYNSVKNREDFVLHGSTLGFVNPDLTGIDNENHVEVIPEFFQFGYNILCIQSHPEYVCMAHTNYIEKGFEKYITFCRKLVNNLMIDKI